MRTSIPAPQQEDQARQAEAVQGTPGGQVDRRPAAMAQRKLSEMIDNSPRSANPNRTGMPDQLKSGIEAMSGMSMDHVKVHYNSSQPAQCHAHAFAQGSDIHLAPGQETHLPHEAWHVVQQAQGRVQATVQLMGGVGINDDKGLEHEADVMGQRALSMRAAVDAVPLVASGPGAAVRQAVVDEDLKTGTKVMSPDKEVCMVIAYLPDEKKYKVLVMSSKKQLVYTIAELTPFEAPMAAINVPADQFFTAAIGDGGAQPAGQKLQKFTGEIDKIFLAASKQAQHQVVPWVKSYSWLALGSYGRNEMCPYSDVELGVVYVLDPAQKDSADANKIREVFGAMGASLLAEFKRIAPFATLDSEGNYPSGKGGAGLTGAASDLPNSIALSHVGEAVEARHTMLMDARFLPTQMQDSGHDAYVEFKGSMAKVMEGAVGKTSQRDVNAAGLATLASQTLNASLTDAGKKPKYIDVKKNFRQPLDWSLMALCVKHGIFDAAGFQSRLEALYAKKVLDGASCKKIDDLYQAIFGARIDLHLHHKKEQDKVVLHGGSEEKSGVSVEEQETIDKFPDGHIKTAQLEAAFVDVAKLLLPLVDGIANTGESK